MEKNLISVFEDLIKKIEKSKISSSDKGKCKNQLSELINQYKDLQISKDRTETYNSLIKKGRELLSQGDFKDSKKLKYYIRYCGAAVYDFEENIGPLNKIVRCYLLTCILFLILSPQYFSFLLPLILLIPIYLGLKGMKNRNRNGLFYAMSVMPMSLLSSTAWLRNAFLASKDFDSFVNSMVNQYGQSFGFTKILLIVFIVLSGVMLLSSLCTIYLGNKYKKMFV